MSETGVSPGEATGWFASVLAALGLGGSVVRWTWGERKAAKAGRYARLDAWQAELDERERAIDAKMASFTADLGARVAQLEQEKAVHARVINMVVIELWRHDPTNAVLALARRLLGDAFPVELAVPPDMEASLRRIDEGG